MNEDNPMHHVKVVATILALGLLIGFGYYFFRLATVKPSPAISAWLGANAPDAWKTWRGDHEEIKYPPDFARAEGGAARGGLISAAQVTFEFPRDAFQTATTNYVEAYAAIGSTDDSRTIKKCYDVPNPEDPTGHSPLEARTTINGTEWRKRSISEAAAGNIFASEVYRLLSGSRCYEIVLTVHTSNIQNYEPGAVTEFDRDAALVVLRKIRDTFRFVGEK